MGILVMAWGGSYQNVRGTLWIIINIIGSNERERDPPFKFYHIKG